MSRALPRAAGVAALEMALLLPVLVLLPAGLWDLGRALLQQERLHHAVRAAARHLAGGDAADAQRQDEARRLAVYGQLSGASQPLVPGLTSAMVRILEPKSEPGVQLVGTPTGPVSLVTVSIEGLRYQPLWLPVAAFTFQPVSLTLAYQAS